MPNLTESAENRSGADRNQPTASGLGGKNLTIEVRDWWKDSGQLEYSSESDD